MFQKTSILFSKLTYFEIQGLNRKYDYGKRAEYYVARLVSSIFKEADNPKRQKLIGELVKTNGGIMGVHNSYVLPMAVVFAIFVANACKLWRLASDFS